MGMKDLLGCEVKLRVDGRKGSVVQVFYRQDKYHIAWRGGEVTAHRRSDFDVIHTVLTPQQAVNGLMWVLAEGPNENWAEHIRAAVRTLSACERELAKR